MTSIHSTCTQLGRSRAPSQSGNEEVGGQTQKGGRFPSRDHQPAGSPLPVPHQPRSLGGSGRWAATQRQPSSEQVTPSARFARLSSGRRVSGAGQAGGVSAARSLSSTPEADFKGHRMAQGVRPAGGGSPCPPLGAGIRTCHTVSRLGQGAPAQRGPSHLLGHLGGAWQSRSSGQDRKTWRPGKRGRGSGSGGDGRGVRAALWGDEHLGWLWWWVHA